MEGGGWCTMEGGGGCSTTDACHNRSLGGRGWPRRPCHFENKMTAFVSKTTC
jgi:hypothetical protein